MGSLFARMFGEPVGGGSVKEFTDRNALAADQKFGDGFERFVECGDTGQGFLAAPTLDLNGYQGVATLQDEIHLEVAFAPIRHLDASSRGSVDQMSAYGRLDQAAPSVAINEPFGRIAAGLGGHQRGVEHLQLWAGGALADLTAGKFRQACDHASAFEKMQVMGERDGVASVHQLAEHLLIGKDLAGIGAGKLEQSAQQRRFVHAVEQQNVAGEGGLNERVVDVLTPALRIVCQRSRTRIPSNSP